MPTRGGTPGTADHGEIGPLSDFIRDYLTAHEETNRGLALRAIDPQTGFSLQHGWIGSLIKGTVPRAPELWRIRALAAAMSVTPQKLAELAAAQYLGVHVVDVPLAEGGRVSVSVPEGLSKEERARFVRMAEDLAKHMRS